MNKTIRNDSVDSIQATKISDLSITEELTSGSLLHVVLNTGNSSYESRQMSTDTFKQKIYESVQNTFKTTYSDTHNHENAGVEYSFAKLLTYLKDSEFGTPSKPDETEPNGFIKRIYYDFDIIKRYMVAKDNSIESNLDTTNKNIDNLNCHFTGTMERHTTAMDNNGAVQNVDSTSNTIPSATENVNYCQMNILNGNKISNTWTCPESGNLVIYGWLDSSSCLNNTATLTAYCAIEGFINGIWEIISVCPVTPAKSIAYVGFNLLVEKGLRIRARTGFECGKKSGQYSNDQDGYDSLSNSTPNGFKCMIFKKGSVNT